MIAAGTAIDCADEIADDSAQSVGACELEAGRRRGLETAQVALNDHLRGEVHGNQRGRLRRFPLGEAPETRAYHSPA